MGPMQEDPTLTLWRRLGETLECSFVAHSRGLLAPDFAILGREGEEIGRLEVHGVEGAELGVGYLEARIERSALSGYTMLTDGAEILTAEPFGAWNAPEIKCLDRLYQGRLSLLRNTARAGPAGEKATVSITGGLTNRNYEAVFDSGDESSLPVAIFLLYLTSQPRAGPILPVRKKA